MSEAVDWLAEARPLPYEVLCRKSDPQWKTLRHDGWGASEIANILGVNRYTKETLDEVIARKARREDIAQNASMRWGDLLQSIVMREGYPDAVEWEELLRSHEHPWLLATPDGVERSAEILVEVKCHSPMTKRDWTDAPPDYVVAQVQTQLLVTGYEVATVVAWCWSTEPRLYPVRRDDALIRAIVTESRAAWDRVIAMRMELGI